MTPLCGKQPPAPCIDCSTPVRLSRSLSRRPPRVDTLLAGELRKNFALTLANFFTERVTNVTELEYTRLASLLARLVWNESDSDISLEDSAPLPGRYGEGKLYPLAELDNPLPPRHDAWVRLAMFLGRNGERQAHFSGLGADDPQGSIMKSPPSSQR